MRRLLTTLLTTIAIASTAHAAGLKPGYVLCESGGQLRWFIGVDSISDLWEPHPDDWTIPIQTTSAEARKALSSGWCATSDNMESFTAEVLENCDKHLPYPNGGCRKVRVRPAKSDHWTTWYTFGDAITP
jgi:hypothetical protein